MSLNKILEEIKSIKGFAEEDTDSGPIETLNGRRGRKNQAIERLKSLKRSYKVELLESAAFIVVTGEKRSDFSSIAEEHFKCFSANPNEFYQDLANRIPESLYKGKESMVNLFDIVGRHLYDKGMELDLSEYNQLIFKQEHHVSVKTKEDLVSLLRSAVNTQIGAEIVGIQAVSSLLNTAINRDHGAKVTPILLTTDNEKLALELEGNLRKLHSRGVFLVVAGKGTKSLKAVPNVLTVKDPTNESVEQALTQISGTVKGK